MRYRWHITYFLLLGVFFLFSWKVYNDSEIPPLTLSNKAAHGKLIWQQNNCIACHQVYGLGGFMGPDLTNVMSDPAKGELYAGAIIKHGLNRMPKYNFKDEDMEALLQYLHHIDSSGIYPLQNYQIQFNGTVTDPVR